MGPNTDLSQSETEVLATRVREELSRRRMSRQALADAAKLSISTLEKALNGSRPFNLASIVRVETELGISMRQCTKKQNKDAQALFGWEAGVKEDERPPLDTYRPDDYNEFIR